MTWKESLSGRIPADLGAEIDTFERQIALRRQGRMDEKVFAETRLRRGVYGQRYDNGQRNDGAGPKPLPYPSDGLTKGPRDHLGRTGDAADQDPDGPAHAGPDGHACRRRRGVQRRRLPRDDPPGHPAPLRPSRRHARPDAPARRGRRHHPRGVRQHCPQRHRLPAGRGLPRRDVRRHAARRGVHAVSARASRRAGLRAQSSRWRSRAAASTPAGWSRCTTSA